MNKTHLYAKAIQKWGVTTQFNMLIEECAELIVAVNKLDRANPEDINDRLEDLQEEIADVEIILEQARFILGHKAGDKIDKIKIKKLFRLRDRITKDTI